MDAEVYVAAGLSWPDGDRDRAPVVVAPASLVDDGDRPGCCVCRTGEELRRRTAGSVGQQRPGCGFPLLGVAGREGQGAAAVEVAEVVAAEREDRAVGLRWGN